MQKRIKFSQELLAAAANLDLRAKRNVTALLAGNYRSTFRGSGMQFQEFRRYEPGDDIRHMSWAVTARSGKPTVKLYEEERELNVLVMVDVSGSSLFGHSSKRKIDMYAELVALMGLASIRSGDKFGLLLFDDQVQFYLPPGRSRNHVLVALTHLLDQKPQKKKSDIRPAFSYAQKMIKSRSLVIIISDFLLPDFSDEFPVIAQKNETILMHCYDDAERGVGLNGVYEVWDPENETFYLLDGKSKEVQLLLAQEQINLTDKLEALCHRNGSDYLCVSLEDNYFQRLVHFFHRHGAARV